MNRLAVGELAQRTYDKAKVVAGLAFLATTTVSGAGGGGYGGYRAGEVIAPNGDGVLGQIAHYATEGTPTVLGALTGAAAGVFIGTWILDGGLVELMEGG